MPSGNRPVILLLVFALLVPALAACGDDDDDDAGADVETPILEEISPTVGEEEEEATPTEAEEETVEATEEGTPEATEEATEEGTPEATEEATEADTPEVTEEATADGELPGEGKTISIAWVPWIDDIAATFLWKALLEEQGYTIELTQIDLGPMFAGLADGSVDAYLDVWLPTTHGEYWDRYGEDLEDLGVWYEPATLELAVPSYVEIDSMAELEENADMFDSRIVGIEPGAGMMGITRNEIMPGYGIEDWSLVESSSAGMLSELEGAIANEEPIVVTLWTPHWAYARYDIKNLEDPEGLWGEPESLHIAAREGFSEDYPLVAQWFSNFEMPDDDFSELMNVINETEQGNEEEAVQEWLSEEDHRELADSWIETD